jgi:hypothetical protein
MPLDTTPTRYVLITCSCQAEATLLTCLDPEIMYSNSNTVFIKIIFLFNVNQQHGDRQQLTFGLTKIRHEPLE